MGKFDLDREFVNLCCFIIAAGLVLFAQVKGVQDGIFYDFANLSAGAALRGFGTSNNKEV